MTNCKSPLSVHRVGLLVAVAAIALAACQKSPESAAVPDAAVSSAEYPVAATAADPAVPAGASIKVTVSLSPAVARKAAPNDVVFVFARATEGPRMPLAIARMQVRDLPTTVVLDDGSAMSPQTSLSTVPEVVVVARVSKSGMANAQPGDLEGTSGPVKRGTRAVSVSISSVVSRP